MHPTFYYANDLASQCCRPRRAYAGVLSFDPTTAEVKMARSWPFWAIVSILSIVLYFSLTYIINGQPASTPFAGAVVVLENSSSPTTDQVKLIARAVEPGAPGENPLVEYVVVVCGPSTFSGSLLLLGDARLSAITAFPRAAVSQLSDVQQFTAADSRRDLGQAQIIPIGITPFPCVSSYSQDPDMQFAGQASAVSGKLFAPVRRDVSFLWWHGPRSAQAWPMIGNFPNSSAGFLGDFYLSAFDKPQLRPHDQYVEVDVGGLSGGASVDLARPSPDPASDLSWKDTRGISPVARITDIGLLSTLQQWDLLAGIAFGIGASILASIALTWRSQSATQDQLDLIAAEISKIRPLIAEVQTSTKSMDREISRLRREQYVHRRSRRSFWRRFMS